MRRVVYLAALLSAAVMPAAVVRAQEAQPADQSAPSVPGQAAPAPATNQTSGANDSPAASDAIVELPLTGPAFTLASEAEKAYASGDYATAVARLREAIRQRPDAASLRGSLIRALEASGQSDEARKELEALTRLGESGSASPAEVGRVQAEFAQKAAEQVYRALERNDYAAAAKSAEEAVRLNPDESAFRHLLILVQLREKAFAAAEQSATDALNDDAEDPVALVFRSASRLKQGEVEKGLADAETALKLDWLGDEDMNNLRLITADYFIAGGEYDKAEETLSGFTGDEKARKARLDAIAQARKSGKKGSQAAVEAIIVPQLECKVTPYGRSCSLVPGAAQADEGYAFAAEAQAAFAARNYDLAVAKAREAMRLSPDNESYKTLLANTLAAQKFAHSAPKGAPARPAAVAAAAPDPGYAAVHRIAALADEKREKDARAAYDRALSSGVFKSLAPLDLAYLAGRVGDKATAYEQFGLARTEGKLHGMQLVDAAYAARRVYDNELAIALIKQAIDEVGDTLEPQQLFNLRREISTLSRTWGAYLSFSHGSTTAMPGGPISDYAVDQMGSEIYWRPPGIGYRDGATFELFARNFITLHDESDGPTGFSTAQASVGARWKPFRQYNLVFEVARLLRLSEHSRNDTMLRMAWSDGAGSDLRVDVPSWWMWSAYGEVGRYLETKQTFGSFDLRGGRSYRADAINDHLVVTPFLGVSGSFDSLMEDKLAVGAGPGLNLRWWFREDKYTAPMSYVDMTVQYKFKLSGDDRAKGLFANLTVSF